MERKDVKVLMAVKEDSGSDVTARKAATARMAATGLTASMAEVMAKSPSPAHQTREHSAHSANPPGLHDSRQHALPKAGRLVLVVRGQRVHEQSYSGLPAQARGLAS